MVTIVEARGLKEPQGKSVNPICTIILGEQKFHTHIESRTVSPFWNNTFTFSQGAAPFRL